MPGPPARRKQREGRRKGDRGETQREAHRTVIKTKKEMGLVGASERTGVPGGLQPECHPLPDPLGKRITPRRT